MSNFITKPALVAVIAPLAALNVFQFLKYRAAEADEERAVENFNKVFYQKDTFISGKWLGVRTLQNPNDVWVHQEIIVETKPDFIIETGTLEGGSAALWAMILREVNPNGRVITIDITDYGGKAKEFSFVRDRVDFLIGSSIDPAIVEDVRRRVGGRPAMVILDSNHTKDHVLKEIKAYAPLVPTGGYLIVQDTTPEGCAAAQRLGLDLSGGGPKEAVAEFLRGNVDFEADRGRERFLFTMHPGGYLQRVR